MSTNRKMNVVLNKISNGDYNPVPNTPPCTDINCTKCLKESPVYFDFCPYCGANLSDAKAQMEEKINNEVSEYDKRCEELFETFKKDSLAALGLTDHPKANLLFFIACQMFEMVKENYKFTFYAVDVIFNTMCDILPLLESGE
jgi:hypothetical protein